jgi:cephalosporin hydroxylase
MSESGVQSPKDLASIAAMAADPTVQSAWRRAIETLSPYRYPYNWSWLGIPAIQLPQDLVAMQEIIWKTKPDVIVETGIAHGGSLIFSASMLALLGANGEAIGIDIDIREQNRKAIESHPLSSRITMFEGSSTDPDLAKRVRAHVGDRTAMVVLDSNHTADHVAREIALYSPLVRSGFYLLVFDTLIEYSEQVSLGKRPWGPGNSPMTAVNEFLNADSRFEIDVEYDQKLLFTVAPRGYLRATADPD